VNCFLFQGKSDRLDSKFRFTYNMVLNTMRVPDISPEYMLEKSFYQFQIQSMSVAAQKLS
jgi:ATP-dependent RNA helicase DOB1